jgi:hypothetical protein
MPTVDFEDFWAAYPEGRHENKKQAVEQWRKLDGVDQVLAINAVKWRVQYDSAWKHPKPDGHWGIPHPFRYLRDRRFTDAQVVSTPTSGRTAGNEAACQEALVMLERMRS